MPTPNHSWSFRPRFRARAFGWRGSSLAAQRMKEAVAEIKAVNRADPVSAAEGAVLLLERLWPALEQIDSSSGALGNAVNKTVHELLGFVIAAPTDEGLRDRWLDRLWAAMEADGVDFLSQVSERWGDLCGTPERASRAADGLIPRVRANWAEARGAYFHGTPACLSCLLAAGRHQELLDLIETAPFLWWHYRRFGVLALAAMGQTDEAIRYAEASLSRNDSPAIAARVCEEMLLGTGRQEEAYARYALVANRAGTNLATFRAIKKKYPAKDPRGILDDLIAATPGEEGKWFATAKTLGYLDLAAALAGRSRVDIGTLIRASRDHLVTNPEFALDVANAALSWMALGEYYEIKAGDVWQAMDDALAAATATDRVQATRTQIRTWIDARDTDAFVKEQMGRHFHALPGG